MFALIKYTTCSQKLQGPIGHVKGHHVNFLCWNYWNHHATKKDNTWLWTGNGRANMTKKLISGVWCLVLDMINMSTTVTVNQKPTIITKRYHKNAEIDLFWKKWFRQKRSGFAFFSHPQLYTRKSLGREEEYHSPGSTSQLNRRAEWSPQTDWLNITPRYSPFEKAKLYILYMPHALPLKAHFAQQLVPWQGTNPKLDSYQPTRLQLAPMQLTAATAAAPPVAKQVILQVQLAVSCFGELGYGPGKHGLHEVS